MSRTAALFLRERVYRVPRSRCRFCGVRLAAYDAPPSRPRYGIEQEVLGEETPLEGRDHRHPRSPGASSAKPPSSSSAILPIVESSPDCSPARASNLAPAALQRASSNADPSLRAKRRFTLFGEAPEVLLAEADPHPGRRWNPSEIALIHPVDTAGIGHLRVRYGDCDDRGLPAPGAVSRP